MLFHKTNSAERGTYPYVYYDEDGKKKVTLRPGENGVTELDIKMLHSHDDAEVYNNIKNCKPPLDDHQKEQIQQWKDTHHGEEPPKNWAFSLDALTDPDNNNSCGDKSKILADLFYSAQDAENLAIERLHEIIESFPESWQVIYQQVILEGIPMTKVAAARKVSETAVRNTVKKIKARIAEDELLKNFTDGVRRVRILPIFFDWDL